MDMNVLSTFSKMSCSQGIDPHPKHTTVLGRDSGLENTEDTSSREDNAEGFAVLTVAIVIASVVNATTGFPDSVQLLTPLMSLVLFFSLSKGTVTSLYREKSLSKEQKFLLVLALVASCLIVASLIIGIISSVKKSLGKESRALALSEPVLGIGSMFMFIAKGSYELYLISKEKGEVAPAQNKEEPHTAFLSEPRLIEVKGDILGVTQTGSEQFTGEEGVSLPHRGVVKSISNVLIDKKTVCVLSIVSSVVFLALFVLLLVGIFSDEKEVDKKKLGKAAVVLSIAGKAIFAASSVVEFVVLVRRRGKMQSKDPYSTLDFKGFSSPREGGKDFSDMAVLQASESIPEAITWKSDSISR